MKSFRKLIPYPEVAHPLRNPRACRISRFVQRLHSGQPRVRSKSEDSVALPGNMTPFARYNDRNWTYMILQIDQLRKMLGNVFDNLVALLQNSMMQDRLA